MGTFFMMMLVGSLLIFEVMETAVRAEVVLLVVDLHMLPVLVGLGPVNWLFAILVVVLVVKLAMLFVVGDRLLIVRSTTITIGVGVLIVTGLLMFLFAHNGVVDGVLVEVNGLNVVLMVVLVIELVVGFVVGVELRIFLLVGHVVVLRL
jgi:hypothetical protein